MKPTSYLIAAATLAGSLAWAQAPQPGQGSGDALTAQQQAVEKTLKQQAADRPGDADARARLAGFYLSSNQTVLAIEAYQDAITLRPDDPRLFLGLAIAYLHAGHHAMARAMTEQALQLDPHLNNAAKLREYIDRKQAALRLHDQHAGLVEDQVHKDQTGGAETPQGAGK